MFPKFEKLITATSILAHGIICGLVLIDGLVLNSIPAQLRHWAELFIPYSIIYSIWSILQLVLEVDNPYTTDDDSDVDTIYSYLDWISSPAMAAAVVLTMTFVMAPIVHIILWGLSLLGRRYIQENDTDTDSEAAKSHDADLETEEMEDIDLENK